MSISPAFKQLRQNGLRMLLVAVLAALYLFPLVRIFSMSFMSASELYASAPSIFPKAFTLENYRSIFQGNIPIFTFLKNTVIMALLITAVQLAVSSITAYALTGLDVPFKNLIFILILGGMMIPFESTILPFLLSPAGIFLMRQQFKSIPKEIYDAAAIDGCGPVRLFLRLLLPMSGNALASLAILSMITAWNQYIWPLLVTDKNEMRTVQVGISMLQGLEFSDYTLVMAGIVLVLLPCVLIFVVGFRFFIAGITEGAVKG